MPRMMSGAFKGKSMSVSSLKKILASLVISFSPLYSYASSSLGIGYFSWTEILDATGAGTFKGFSSFYGNSIYYRYNTRGSKDFIESSILVGKYTSVFPSFGLYTTENKNFMGLMSSYRKSLELSPQVYISAGPLILLRNVKYTAPIGYEVKSGSDLNLGLLAEIQFQLTPKIEVKQSMGTLFFKARTFWSLSLGYNY